MANAALIKVNQIGTVTETLTAMAVCRSAGYVLMVSHRSGETPDAFLAVLVVGSSCGQLKSGAPARGERVAKYIRLRDRDDRGSPALPAHRSLTGADPTGSAAVAAGCPLCAAVESSSVVIVGGLAVAIPDAFPLATGHHLVLSRHHEPEVFALGADEIAAMSGSRRPFAPGRPSAIGRVASTSASTLGRQPARPSATSISHDSPTPGRHARSQGRRPLDLAGAGPYWRRASPVSTGRST